MGLESAPTMPPTVSYTLGSHHESRISAQVHRSSSPYVNVPAASYSLPPGGACPFIGVKTPLTQAQLDALYSSHGMYVNAVAKGALSLVRNRFVLPTDGVRIIKEAARADVP